MSTRVVPTASIIPSPWQVCHIPRHLDTTTEDDHGNYPLVPDDPVIRNVMSVTQFGRRGSSSEIMGAEFAERIETTLHMAVADPTVYKPDDHIILFPELDDDGNYIDGSGVAFWVDGDPSDERMGPWPALLAVFGGLVKIRRVT